MKYIKISMQIALLNKLVEKELITSKEYDQLLNLIIRKYELKNRCLF